MPGNSNNHQPRYANISAGLSNERSSHEHKHAMAANRYSYHPNDAGPEVNTNFSNESVTSHRFKSMSVHTPIGATGPVRLPNIIGGFANHRNDANSNDHRKVGLHHYSTSEAANYAIGAGKTATTGNLKATVSGGKLYISGVAPQEDRERIEYKCSPSGKVSKLSPAKNNQQDGDSQYNCYYHKFRQQNKSITNSQDYKPSIKGLQKNKFPLPFTGIEYPFIDGGGITS